MEFRHATAYRSGLMHSERIEEALRAGEIRGIASTSGREIGIDIPDLQVGLNPGLPHPVGSVPAGAAAHPAAPAVPVPVSALADAFISPASSVSRWASSPMNTGIHAATAWSLRSDRLGRNCCRAVRETAICRAWLQ